MLSSVVWPLVSCPDSYNQSLTHALRNDPNETHRVIKKKKKGVDNRKETEWVGERKRTGEKGAMGRVQSKYIRHMYRNVITKPIIYN